MTDLLFSGCTIQARLPFIESAFKYIAKEMGKEINDLQDSTCCMEPVGLRSVNEDAWLAVNARLHSLSSGKRIVTLCEGCNISLSESSEALAEDDVRSKFKSRFGYEPNISEVAGSLQFLYENLDQITSKIKKPIDMKLAMFPGCHCEYVCSKKEMSAVLMMDAIMKAVGSNSIRLTEDLCCGGGVSMIDPQLDKEIITETSNAFRDTDADATVTACPFCFMRFDMVAKFKVYHIVEIVAMAMGYDDTTKYHVSK